jgi:hypothetical protein
LALHLIASVAPNKKPLVLLRQDHYEAMGSVENVSKNDEVMSSCRRVTLLRHAIEYGTEMLAEEENSDHSQSNE